MAAPRKRLPAKELEAAVAKLKARFEGNPRRHPGLKWSLVEARIASQADKIWSLSEMERTGGEPDVVGPAEKGGALVFMDCAAQSPAGRRSLCFDREALDSRKTAKPKDSAMEVAAAMGVALLSEEQYRHLQTAGEFDTTTSSWIETPADVRKLGGALFMDRRYGKVFLYHNGAESYYAARGFRASLRV